MSIGIGLFSGIGASLKNISTLNGSDSLHMTSFDVENLYTNIPLVETIDIILDKLFTSPCSVM